MHDAHVVACLVDSLLVPYSDSAVSDVLHLMSGLAKVQGHTWFVMRGLPYAKAEACPMAMLLSFKFLLASSERFLLRMFWQPTPQRPMSSRCIRGDALASQVLQHALSIVTAAFVEQACHQVPPKEL